MDMQSVWKSQGSLPSFAPMQGDRKTGVLVIGGGITGILTAYRLHCSGIDCLLVEADTLAGGVTGNTTAKLTVQHGAVYADLIQTFGKEKAKQYLDANRMALETYKDMCGKIDCDYAEMPSYVFSRTHWEKMEREAAAMEALGYPAEFVQNTSLPFGVAGAVRCPGQGQFHPLRFLAALVGGLNICEHTRVLDLEGTTAITDKGKICAEKVIVATHYPFLRLRGLYFLKMYQHRSYVLALKNAPIPDGMYVEDGQTGLSFWSFGELLLLGGGGHRTGKSGGGWAELREFASRHYPKAKEVCHWAAQDCETLDKVPYIGAYGENCYVATGFGKWGMTTAMAASEILRDAVLGKKNPYASVFSPGRSILHPQLGANMLESAVHLLKPTVPRCPHMGCALKWNPEEGSWDCPCHGSRFSQTGTLLNDPAQKDLKVGDSH